VERLLDTLNVINHFSCDMQVAVIAGKNEKFSRDISEFEWHIPVHIYDFVENMPTLMKASDLLVCKAGGLIVTESLASGLPMMLIEVIPGQETGNAEYVIAYGAADMAQSPIEVLELLSHLMKDNQSLLKKRAANAAMLGKPRSAIDTATVLWKAIESNSNKIVTPRHRRSRPEGPPPS
jgi:UDP-N-acetylglucosamine:LPS N-acetylglucosamine transferase